MALQFILMAAQAAGIGMNMYENSKANKIMAAGTRVEQQELDLRMEQLSLQSAEQGLQNLQQLREVMASQRALLGARGQMGGVGSMGAMEQTGLRAFGDDERARKLSLGFAKTQLQGQKRLLDINRHAVKAKQGADMVKQGMNMMSPNQMMGQGTASTSVIKNLNQS